MAINQEIIDSYKRFEWEKLLRDDLGNSGNLNEIKMNLERIRNVFDKMFSYDVSLSQIPAYENTFASVVKNFLQEAINQLVVSYSNVAERESRLNYVKNTEQNIVNQLMPIVNYLVFSDTASNTGQQDLKKKLKEADTKLKDLDVLLEKVKNAAEISGKIAEKQEVELYGNEFEGMAKQNKVKADKSQLLMMVTLAITVFVACIFVFGKQFDLISKSNVWNFILEQNVLVKLFLISAGGYLVAHFSRNYSAEMNMYYTNKHRQLALNSHQRILDAARPTETPNEAETKNAILLQVAKTMFDVQDSGYLKSGNNPVPSTQVIETVRTGLTK
jgi:hypothetical protein